ncbi:MAG: response regulator transcription factor [Bacteroidetes bacterium]|nr:response regulator transcription factor [Bacteroidota bacterium]MBS1590514.1 response regulator transcription factor [Bacteroidota bacterium]MBS1642436.1 response regulator transcription factor [Bacteroidota bacterium]MBS1671564.1 response regulator transcription factor [Bacteroidota bacterium]
MEKQYKILLVEDEIKLATVIKQELTSVGFIVDIATDGLLAQELFMQHNYSLALLDINLPGKNGRELCKTFRNADADISIIMLTALGEIQDKVDAFKFGADDYIVKPFYFEELIARIKAALKRTSLSEDNILSVHDLSINLKTKAVTRAGHDIPLTAKEFALLTLLVKNQGKVISKQEIMGKVWDLNFDTGTNAIEVYISFLRNKIDKPYTDKLIQTKAGFGYFIK